VVRLGVVRKALNILFGKPRGKRPLGRPRHRWVSDINMGLRERGLDSFGSG
jgi:hypothetical protein